MKIERIKLRKILDSRGDPTIEADVYADGCVGRAAAPSGASKGKYEAKTLPVDAALNKARDLIRRMEGMEIEDQESIDRFLHEYDGTPDFSNIGANVAIAISLACAKAAASANDMQLFEYLGGGKRTPIPLGNVMNGGAHAVGAMDIQEFLSIPIGASNISDAVFANATVHRNIKSILKKEGIACGKGDEGGWCPPISDEKALEIFEQAVEDASSKLGFEIKMGLDVAASSLWCEDRKKYVYKSAMRSEEEQIEFMEDVIKNYSMHYVEDPLHEEDFEGFAELMRRVKCLICGDDLLVTNPERIEKAASMKAVNCVLIKPNQIGTLSDTKRAVEVAKKHGCDIVVSHRSGETTDETIAHLAVAFDARYIKTGVVGGERIAKLNELIRIGELIG